MPLPLGYDPIGGGGGIRTHTVLILSQVPLPVGVHLQSSGARGGTRTPIRLNLNQTALPFGAHGRVVPVAGFEPAIIRT